MHRFSGDGENRGVGTTKNRDIIDYEKSFTVSLIKK